LTEPTAVKRPPVWPAYGRLFPVILADFRTTGPFYVFFSVLLPAGILFFVHASGGAADPVHLRFLAGGALAATLAMGPAVMLCARLGLAREHREFDYWATLPVPKISLVLALCTGHLLFSLPGVAAMLALAYFALSVPGTAVLATLPLIPLACLTLAGIGAFLGSRAPNSIVGNLIGNLILAVVLFLSPLMTQLSGYPAFLRPVAYAIPTTYVADAFRHVLSAAPTYAPMWVDLTVMGGLTLLLVTLTHRLLDWRSA
jgi:ABC-2 type transport system permease protein